MTALKNETLEAATPSESTKTSPCKELEAVYQAGTSAVPVVEWVIQGIMELER